MRLPISDGTRQRVRILFPHNVDEVCELLLRSIGDELMSARGAERIRFAALKISDGNLDTLKRAVELAKRDFRDVLLWADFGEPSEHEKWFPEPRR